MNNKTCSFFCHSEIIITEDLKNKVREILDKMINQSDFIVFYAKDIGRSGAYKIYQYAKKIEKI